MKYVPLDQIFQQLEEIKQQINVNNVEFLDTDEAAEYLKLKKSYLYLLIHRNEIPFYKPNGKKVYFNKIELNEWILKSKRKTNDEIAEEYQSKKSFPLTSYKQVVQSHEN